MNHRNDGLGDLPVYGSNKKRKSIINGERLRDTHSMSFEILLKFTSSCQLQVAQTLYENVELGDVHL